MFCDFEHIKLPLTNLTKIYTTVTLHHRQMNPIEKNTTGKILLIFENEQDDSISNDDINSP